MPPSAISEESFNQSDISNLLGLLSAIAHSSSDIFFVKDLKGQYVMANKIAADWLGTTVAAMLGHDDTALFPLDIAKAIQEADRNVLHAATQVVYEETLVLDGEARTLLTTKSPWFHPDGKLLGLIGLCRDITEQKQAAKMLQVRGDEARDHLTEIELIYETAPVGLAVLDRELRFRRINHHLAEINGISVTEHIGRCICDVVPALADKIEPMLRQVINTGEPLLNLEIHGETPAQPGVARTWLESWHPLRDAKGYVTGINIVCQEITERKRAEANHRQAEQSLRKANIQIEAALAAGSVYTWNWDISDNLVTVNTTFAHLFGIDSNRASTTGLSLETFLQAIHPDDRAQVSANIQQSVETGKEYVAEYRVKTSTGEERWVSARGHVEYDSAGNPVAFPGALADITERKRAEDDRDRFFSLSRDMLALANTEGYFIQVNAAWTRVLGYTEQELLEHPYLYFVHPDDRAITIEKAQQLNQGIPTISFENRYRCKGGTYCWLEWSVTPFPDENLLYAVAHDITRRKHSEFEREKLLEDAKNARDDAERANQIKDEFLAVLSHELRTPLNPILGWAQILKRKKLGSEKEQEGIAAIERNALLQIQLVDDLLDVSRILRGKLVLNAESVDLAVVAVDAIETVQLAATAKKIQIQTELPVKTHFVKGDAARLQQVVWNLLSNAIKFTPDQGTVTVHLRTFDKRVELEISDTGKGISAEFIPHVFEHFKQADGGTTRTFGGLGLGLAIASKLIELHGGTVSAESPGEGQGATFTLRLPAVLTRQELLEEQTMQISDGADLPLAGLTLLLVDDEPDSLEVAHMFLEMDGADVTAVNSPETAMEMLTNTKFDGLICDVGMPKIDGHKLIQWLRAQPSNQNSQLPAIALSAYARKQDKEVATLAGFQGHVSKPFDADLLSQMICQICKGD